MKTHDVRQGSSEWHALRARHYCASEAAAMMGDSPYQPRAELLRAKATGVRPEHSPEQELAFAAGHAAEAAALPVAERLIGDDLYPVTCTAEIEGLPLLASMDGLTLDGTTGFEHKLRNAETIAYMAEHGEPPLHHVWQLEHQLLVTGAESVLFVCSDGGDEMPAHCWYRSRPERRAALIAGWRQFHADLASFAVTPAEPVVMPAPVESLPSLSLRVDGALTVAGNLDLFGTRLREFVASVPREPSTDQEFADAEAACKVLQRAQDALEQAESSALAQIATVEQMRRTVADCVEIARSTRLLLERVVKQRKEQIKIEIVTAARRALDEHVQMLNARFARPYLPQINADFGSAIKGKKTVQTIRDAADAELAQAKVRATAICEHIEASLRILDETAGDHMTLFPDFQQLALKPHDDLVAIIRARIAEHQAAEQRRIEAQQAAAPVRTPEPSAAPAAAPSTTAGATLSITDLRRMLTIPIDTQAMDSLGLGRADGAWPAAEFSRICEALIARIRYAHELWARYTAAAPPPAPAKRADAPNISDVLARIEAATSMADLQAVSDVASALSTRKDRVLARAALSRRRAALSRRRAEIETT